MRAPGGIGEVDGLGKGVVVGEKGGGYAEGAGAGYGLGDCELGVSVSCGGLGLGGTVVHGAAGSSIEARVR